MRYYFHIREQGGLILDEEGSELAGMAAARSEARASALDFAIDDLRSGHPVDERLIEITTQTGTLLESVSVRATVTAKP